MFRDQSEEIAAKVQAEAPGPATKSTQPLSLSSSENQQMLSSSSAPVLPVMIQPEKARGSIDFFINNFACDETSGMKTNLFWVPKNFSDLLTNDCVMLSAQCTGAMALARLHRSSDYAFQAHRLYALAIRSLAKMWQQKEGIQIATS